MRHASRPGRSSIRWFALAAVCVALATPALVWPATQSPPVLPGTADGLAADATIVDQAQADLHTLLSQAHGKRLGDSDLKTRLATIPALQARIAGAIGDLTPRLADCDARLAQLGPPPGPSQPPEDPENAATRRSLARYHAQVDSEIKQARLLDVEASQGAKFLADQLRANFAARLWTQSRSVLDPTLWRDFVAAAPADLSRLAKAIGEETRQIVVSARSTAQLAYWIVAALLAIFLVGPARAWLNRAGYRRATAGPPPPSDLRKSLLALWRVLVATLTPLAAGLVLRGALTDSLTPEFHEAASLTIRVVVFVALLRGLGTRGALADPAGVAPRAATRSGGGEAGAVSRGHRRRRGYRQPDRRYELHLRRQPADLHSGRLRDPGPGDRRGGRRAGDGRTGEDRASGARRGRRPGALPPTVGDRGSGGVAGAGIRRGRGADRLPGARDLHDARDDLDRLGAGGDLPAASRCRRTVPRPAVAGRTGGSGGQGGDRPLRRRPAAGGRAALGPVPPGPAAAGLDIDPGAVRGQRGRHRRADHRDELGAAYRPGRDLAGSGAGRRGSVRGRPAVHPRPSEAGWRSATCRTPTWMSACAPRWRRRSATAA